MRPETRLLLVNLEQAFDATAWHGTPLARSLRGVTAKQALWRPGPERNCIWDLVLHMAYWKYVVRCRLTGVAANEFPLTPANFPRLPEPANHKALARDIKLLRTEHDLLVKTVARFPAARLNRRGRQWTPLEEILGIAAHDLYHCGQIQLIKVLYARR